MAWHPRSSQVLIIAETVCLGVQGGRHYLEGYAAGQCCRWLCDQRTRMWPDTKSSQFSEPSRSNVVWLSNEVYIPQDEECLSPKYGATVLHPSFPPSLPPSLSSRLWGPKGKRPSFLHLDTHCSRSIRCP